MKDHSSRETAWCLVLQVGGMEKPHLLDIGVDDGEIRMAMD